MSARIPSGSPRAQFARAMVQILRTPSGKVLRRYLEEEVLGPLSAVDPAGVLVDDRTILLVEGQKMLAKKLLAAADVDGKLIGEGEARE